jgi:hypothetical protein
MVPARRVMLVMAIALLVALALATYGALEHNR